MERLNRFGVRTVITDPGTNNVINSLRNSINVVFIESVSNPLLRVYDVPEIVKASHEAGATVVVDNTLATPIGLTPINHGVDFVIHSATKYLSGHNDVVAGFIVGNDDRIKGVWEWRRFLGTIMEPFTAFLLNRGLKTLHIRMRTHEENAKAVAEFLMNHPKVERVYYPCLNNHETHETAKKLLSNCGGIVSFEVRGGGLKEPWPFINTLR